MASRGYDGATTPVVEPLTTAQRQRLEAVTFARKLVGQTHNVERQHVNLWLDIAEYIITGESP